MPVTLIEQQTKATGRVNFLIRQLGRLGGGKWNVSPGPYPHDAETAKPKNFEKSYKVTVKRLELPDLPSDWTDREHWQPLMIRRVDVEKSKRLLYYWHGSAFINMITPFHWKFLGRLAHELDADVVIQTYTMVPFAGISDNMPKLLALYQCIHAIAKESGQEFIIGGDSAGGHITTSVLLGLHDNKMPLPDQTFLIAPSLTLEYETPENKAIQPYDPALSIDRTVPILRAWAVGGAIDAATIYEKAGPVTKEQMIKMKHPYADVINSDWSFLREAKTPITIIQGTYDVLLPQVRQFVEKAKQLDLELTYIEADRACHVYPLVSELAGGSWLAPDSVEGTRLLIQSILKYCKD